MLKYLLALSLLAGCATTGDLEQAQNQNKEQIKTVQEQAQKQLQAVDRAHSEHEQFLLVAAKGLNTMIARGSEILDMCKKVQPKATRYMLTLVDRFGQPLPGCVALKGKEPNWELAGEYAAAELVAMTEKQGPQKAKPAPKAKKHKAKRKGKK